MQDKAFQEKLGPRFCPENVFIGTLSDMGQESKRFLAAELRSKVPNLGSCPQGLRIQTQSLNRRSELGKELGH